MRILVSGDVHGRHDIKKLGNDRIRMNHGQLPEVLLVCGDFGFPWYNDPNNREDNHFRKWFDDKPYYTIVIPGNHDNYARINDMEQTTLFGAKVRQYSPNIFFVERNEILDIDGKTFYCFGGATSADKENRIIGISWWPEESATFADGSKMVNVVTKNPSVNYILSHTCPQKWVKYFPNHYHSDVKCPTRDALDWLEENLSYERWFFGHWHRDENIDEKGQCLFYKTVALGDYEESL